MAQRLLTDVYVLMRNNAIQRQEIYCDQSSSDRMALVKLRVDGGNGLDSAQPPVWLSHLDEMHFILGKLTEKINELKLLHTRYFNRPTLEDGRNEEMKIEKMSQEISNMINACHRLLQVIKSHCSDGCAKTQQLTRNVTRALATIVQDLTLKYKMIQSQYLRAEKLREQNTRLFSEDDEQNGYDTFAISTTSYEGDNLMSSGTDTQFGYTQSQKFVDSNWLEMDEEVAYAREKDIHGIVASIREVNHIFNDLAHMIMEQGTVLDQIDFNIQNTHIQVEQGFRQLAKADEYMRSNQKLYCILLLATTTIVMTCLLIIVKF